MSKEYQSSINECIGCESVQKMMREIDELKNAKAHRILMLSVFATVLMFLAVSFVVWNHMLRQPVMIQQMPASQLKDVSELFNAQFSNLLTVMGGLITIFGFILPLVNLYYQRQTLKEERESIKREVDRSLEVIKEQVKNFDLNLRQAQEVRKTEIADVRDSLAKTIDAARKNFQGRQDDVDKKLAEHEERRCLDNGYFMQQLAIVEKRDAVRVAYYCNALPYLSKYSTSPKVQQRLETVLESLKTAIINVPDEQFLRNAYFSIIASRIKKAKGDLTGNYHFSSILDEIKGLIKKKRDNAVASAKQTLAQ